MKCANHPDIEAAGVCVACGKPFCVECIQIKDNRYFCLNHLESPVPAEGKAKPVLAAVLNILPGLGYLYMGMYQRALIAFLIFVALTHAEGPWVAALMAFCAFDAHRLARGIGGQTGPAQASSRSLGIAGGIALIVVGLLFTLNEFYEIDMSYIGQLWPLVLIGVGAWLIAGHFLKKHGPVEPPEVPPQV